ncbi:hypothetical protein GDO81_028727 [Engystomops pustulosus]|uniref:Lysophosphatidic acid phosphatase type 6 n=1 Tax=Engystomops pustulosus TaxID=76066 RepID=A0AAV6ZCP5_ENGPU|nr:hypothetical protein GDO81_028727 [Engystomops pustulosus]
MNIWARSGLVGSIFYFLHKKRLALAEQLKQDIGQRQDYELKLVQVVYRHGARTPLKPIPHNEQVEWSPNLLEAPDHTQFNYQVTDLLGGPRPPSPFEERYRSHKLKVGTGMWVHMPLPAVHLPRLCLTGRHLPRTAHHHRDAADVRPGSSSAEGLRG